MYIALLLGVLPGMIVINRGHSRRSLSFGAVLILAGVAISFAAGIRSQLAVRPATRTILKFRPRTLITGVLVVSALLIAAQLAIGLTAPS
jgi:amino acid transporter